MPWAAKTFKPGRPGKVYNPSPKNRARRLMYNKEWRAASRRFRAKNPLCADCLLEGKTVQSEVTDHVIPHKGDLELFWDETNWRALCVMHHNRKTVLEDGGFGNACKDHSKKDHEEEGDYFGIG